MSQSQGFATEDTFSIYEDSQNILSASLPKDGNAEILYFDPSIIIVGERSIPWHIIASPDFSAERLPDEFVQAVYSARMMTIMGNFKPDDSMTHQAREIPEWITSFSELRYLHLTGLQLTETSTFAKLKVRYLILSNITIPSPEAFTQQIIDLHGLEYMAHNFPFSDVILTNLTIKRPDLILLTVDDFFEKAEKGEIPFDVGK